MSDPFIAEIRIFAGNFAPRGWAFCDGQLLSIAQNTALFSLVGTTYGGDGRTTFGLPGLQGRAPMHSGNGPGLTQRRIGQNGGVPNVTLTSAQIPSHTHEAKGASGENDQQAPEGKSWASMSWGTSTAMPRTSPWRPTCSSRWAASRTITCSPTSG